MIMKQRLSLQISYPGSACTVETSKLTKGDGIGEDKSFFDCGAENELHARSHLW